MINYGFGTKTIVKWINKLGFTRPQSLVKSCNSRRYNNRKTNTIKKYGVSNTSKLQSVRDSISKSICNYWYNKTDYDKQILFNKVHQTKLKRYGDANYNNMNKNKQTKLDRYGSETYNNINKNNRTRSINRTSGKSKPEDDIYIVLSNKYNNVYRQVGLHDTSRMFIDFYIDNKLYLDLHGVFWHNYRPFTSTLQDINKYNELKSKGGMYKSIAIHWRYDDVRKINYCIEHNLNYLVIYYYKLPSNIIDIITKYNKGVTIIIMDKNNNYTVQRLS